MAAGDVISIRGWYSNDERKALFELELEDSPS